MIFINPAWVMATDKAMPTNMGMGMGMGMVVKRGMDRGIMKIKILRGVFSTESR